MAYLELSNVDTAYGKSQVLFDISMAVEEGQLVALIGRNGAGKTTTLRSITGQTPPLAGTITFDGRDITDFTPEETSNAGIAMIPEDRQIFSRLTVEENLRIGTLGHETADKVGEMFDIVFKYFPVLEERLGQKAGTLSGGEQQQLAIGRALVSDPDILLVDEPTEGLMPTLVQSVRDILSEINESGLTMVLVEQNADLALGISDYTYILNEGQIQDHDRSEVFLADDSFKEKYFIS